MKFNIALGILTLLFIGTMFGSLFHMMMEGGATYGQESACPFMLNGTAVCSMDASEHLSMWKNTYTAVMPIFLLFLGGATVLLLRRSLPYFLWATPSFFVPLVHFFIRLMRGIQTVFMILLFSRGILHPKLF